MESWGLLILSENFGYTTVTDNQKMYAQNNQEIHTSTTTDPVMVTISYIELLNFLLSSFPIIL